MNENELSKIVVDCIFKVHKNLGPGLLESLMKNACFMSCRKQA
jgi:hypothetical protein